MTWIKFVPFEEASGRLRAIYDKYKRANYTFANIISAHSLRPHMLEGHMALYRSVIGHSGESPYVAQVLENRMRPTPTLRIAASRLSVPPTLLR